MGADEVLEAGGVAVPDEDEDEVEKFREFLDSISPEDFGSDRRPPAGSRSCAATAGHVPAKVTGPGPRHCVTRVASLTRDGGCAYRSVRQEHPACSSTAVVLSRRRRARAVEATTSKVGVSRDANSDRAAPAAPDRAGAGPGHAFHRRPAGARTRPSATAGRSPAGPPGSPTGSWTTGPAPGWSSRPCGRRPGPAPSGCTGSATSWCSRWSSGCWTPASRCSRSGSPSTHLRERGVEDLAQITLMSDGASVYECTSTDEVIDLVQGGQGVFGIAVGRVWREVECSLAELPGEHTAREPARTTGADELARRRRARATG